MHLIPVGVDSETIEGKPFTFQFFSKETDDATIIWLKNPMEASRKFFAYLDSLPTTRDRHYVLFGHNLAFDFVSFFYDKHPRLREETIKGEQWHGWNVEIVYAAVRFGVFTKRQKRVTVIDTGAYFVTSLRKLADVFCPQLPKLDAPEGLGKYRFTRENEQFCKYAMRDAEIAYYVGCYLIEKHREYDVSLAVSGPHFASKVFRRHFLKKTIPLPPRKIVYASMASYHGGKNNLTVAPGYYREVRALDIKSAYPFAMSSFPSFSNPDLYQGLYGKGTPPGLPPFGVYKISGHARRCKWPSLYTHNFKPLQGDFSDVWTTGFELNEALRCKEVDLETCEGYFYAAEMDTEASPFAGYVREFFEKKETATDKPSKEFNKLLLNSLYGKFIQTRKADGFADLTYDLDDEKLITDASIQAGGLFNPFIATLITGHTRAYIHRLEHEFHALHTSTDGIQTQDKFPLSALRKYGLPGTLGSLAVETCGDCLILRNKLYIFYSRMDRGDRKNGAIASKLYKGKKIIKSALHGFHADVSTLEMLWKTGTRDYEYVKVNKLRESLRRKLQVNDFVTRRASLTLEADAG